MSPVLAGEFVTTEPPGKPFICFMYGFFFFGCASPSVVLRTEASRGSLEDMYLLRPPPQISEPRQAAVYVLSSSAGGQMYAWV